MKRAAFRAGDTEAMKAAQKDLNRQLKEARRKRKEQAEQDLANSNTKRLWDSIRKMTNINSEKKPIAATDESAMANELIKFFLRFECDTYQECCDIIDGLKNDVSRRIVLDIDTVSRVFKTIKTNKATGPDSIHAPC